LTVLKKIPVVIQSAAEACVFKGEIQMSSKRVEISRRSILAGAGALTAGAVIGAPSIVRAQSTGPIRIGMPTIQSGAVAMIGTSSLAAVQMEVDRFNGAGGLGGRLIQLTVRDTKGRADEGSRVAREFFNDGFDLLLDCEASTAAFAIHEVVRTNGMLCMHAISETADLTADPKMQIPNAFRSSVQTIHEAVCTGAYMADVMKKKKITKLMTVAPDFVHGRAYSADVIMCLKLFYPQVEIVYQGWTKLGQPDFVEIINKINQDKPPAVWSNLFGGDIISFMEQGNSYGLFEGTEWFLPGLGDIPAAAAVKQLPTGIHMGIRCHQDYPATDANRQWHEEYRKKTNTYATAWSWHAAAGMRFYIEALRKAGTTDQKAVAAALRGLKIDAPWGTNGTLTMREGDQTLVDYATGWGTSIPKHPYLVNIVPADWKPIYEIEQVWKKQKGFV
jgi:branched-chain amino acid transport system substrate-binding protein